MRKLPDWEIEFDAFLNRNLYTPFEWGKWDCITFSNKFVIAMTEESLLPNTWKWTNEKEAMQSIFKYGKGKGLVPAIENAIKLNTGIEEIKPNYIQKGDFGVYKEENELCFMSDGINALGVDDDGIVVKHNVDVVKAWRIDV